MHQVHVLQFRFAHQLEQDNWAAWYNTWLFIKLMLKDIVFFFLFLGKTEVPC